MKKLVLGSLFVCMAAGFGNALASDDEVPHETRYVFLDSAVGSYNADMDFPPGVPQSFYNPMFWTVNATCSIEMTGASADIKVEVKKGSGRVNNRELSKGMGPVVFTVHNSDILNMSADSGAEVELINTSAQNIKAHCSM